MILLLMLLLSFTGQVKGLGIKLGHSGPKGALNCFNAIKTFTA